MTRRKNLLLKGIGGIKMIAAVWMGLFACFGALMGADIAYQMKKYER